MATLDINVNAVPEADQVYVDRLRTFINDTAALNDLLEAEESTDLYLYHCLQDALDELNYEITPSSVNYSTLAAVPSWNVLKMGATLQVLTGKGIGSSRNTVSYNDSGNLQMKDQDVFGRYINYYNILVAKHLRAAQAMKLASNMDDAWGGSASEYSNEAY